MAGERWHGWASFALGLWLAISPWVAGYSQHEAATGNAAFVGLALALASHFQASSDEAAMQWPILAAGAWLVISPFACDFSMAAVPTANAIAVGIAVAALAASALELGKGIGRLRNRHVAGH